jgi:Xaa-Pro aminopeptidase
MTNLPATDPATTAAAADLRGRLARAGSAAAAAGVDALLVSPGPDLRYLTGYDAKALERLTCLVLPSDGAPTLLVPALERPAAEASGVLALDLQIVPWQETDDPYALVSKVLPGGAGRVAVDNHMWAEKVLAFRAALPETELTLAGEILRELRMRKSPAEVDALREAGAAIDRVHARIGEWLRPGRTERAVGRDIHDAILAEGHVQVDFVIVGSGPNSASPHHAVSDRVIERGEPVVVDIGGTTAAGYCSDETRTYIADGEPPVGMRRWYDVLRRAQEAACAHVRPGVTAESVDAVARDIISEAGHGDAFIHRTGHGIGLEGHEDPYIVAGNTCLLEPGMAFSVEPGIYFEGSCGARIEDIVVVTETGVEAVNTRPHTLSVVAG